MNIDLYRKSINFAALAHAGQNVPGKPYCYLAHITSVVVEIIAAIPEIKYANADLAVQCAILHDILEDTDVTTVELENEFGLSVRKGVSALTKNPVRLHHAQGTSPVLPPRSAAIRRGLSTDLPATVRVLQRGRRKDASHRHGDRAPVLDNQLHTVSTLQPPTQ